MLQNIDLNNDIHRWIADTFPRNTILISQIAYKVLIILLIFLALNTLFNLLFSPIIKQAADSARKKIYSIGYEKKVHKSFFYFVSIGISYLCIDYFFERYHPQSYGIINRIFVAALVVVIINLGFRLLNSFERFYQLSRNYKGTAMVTLLQSIKVFGYLIASLALIMLLFNVKLGSLLATLGATTAIFVLVFRDTILGIISGFNVAISRTIKVGDWIAIPKYNLEGTVAEINLLTSKIANFDNTVSTIPTYDLITTEVKNMQVLIDNNSRRIQRSIIFNVNSFTFMNEEMRHKWQDINLIADYIQQKLSEINEERKNIPHNENIINGKQLTNIGVFRIYITNYLKSNPLIDNENTIVVRQKPVTAQGLPLEIYCFTRTGSFEAYERIQADIFDHILVTASYFELEILQSKI